MMGRPGVVIWLTVAVTVAVTVVAVSGGTGCAGKKGPTTPSKIAGVGGDDIEIPKVDPTLCDTKGKEVTTFDLNQDGKPDAWLLTEEKDLKGTKVKVKTCKQVDLNYDGKKDYIVQYDDEGNIVLEIYDLDFDGKFDARFHYDKKTHKRYLVERVTGFGNQVDQWEKYDADEKLESIRRDRNHDGKPDYWEQYRAGVLEKIMYDDDYDGIVDRKDEIRAESAPTPATPTAAAPASQPAAAKKPK
jgi:hypothetical protein